uniref:Uncharacterized protein n=1 Tax=Clytia hemisphaerica TaxID=252671 RepID=A0A7M5VDB3_9CNID|eukprot:TCONS_00012924-protein
MSRIRRRNSCKRGVSAVTGGLFLCFCTVATGGGALAVAVAVGGAALAGGGSSMVINPLSKKHSGERMTPKDYATDVTVGTIIGAASGGFGVGSSAITEGAKGAVKLGVRVASGAVSGIVGGGISETGRKVKGEEVNGETALKSMAMGIITGGIGGASGHLASNLSKIEPLKDAITKPVIRIATETVTNTSLDAGIQIAETGKVDPAKLLQNAGAQLVTSVAGECGRRAGKNVAKQTQKRMVPSYNDEQIKKDGNIKDEKTRDSVKEQLEKVNKIPDKEISDLVSNSDQIIQKRDQFDSKFDQLTADLNQAEKTKKQHQADKSSILGTGDKSNLNDKQLQDLKQLQSDNRKNEKKIKATRKEITALNKNGKPDLLLLDKHDNLHCLGGKHKGRVAVDLNNNNGNNGRGTERLLLETANGKPDSAGQFVLVAYVPDHNYNDPRIPPPKNGPHLALPAYHIDMTATHQLRSWSEERIE